MDGLRQRPELRHGLLTTHGLKLPHVAPEKPAAQTQRKPGEKGSETQSPAPGVPHGVSVLHTAAETPALITQSDSGDSQQTFLTSANLWLT